MKVIAFHSDKERDTAVVESFIRGLISRGDQGKSYLGDYPDDVDADAVIIFGVKGRERFERYRAAGVTTIYVDKGYLRRGKPESFWRIAINAHHPTAYLMDMDYPGDRWGALNIPIKPWRTKGNQVVFAGSSLKFHAFNQLTDPTTYAAEVVAELGKHTDRPIMYRPKPTWNEAEPVPGAEFSRLSGGIRVALEGAHALVTHGSNACFEAMCEGIPCIILGDGVAAPISSHRLADIETPRMVKSVHRIKLLHNLAYCQFTIAEFQQGFAWDLLRRRVAGASR